MNIEKLLLNTVKVSIALLIFTLPIEPRWGNYSLILLGLVSLALCLRAKEIHPPPSIVYLLALMYFVRIIWLIGSEDFHYGLRTLEVEIPLLAMPLVFTLILSFDKLKQFAIRLYVLTALCLILFVVIQFIHYLKISPYPFIEHIQDYINPFWFWEHSRYFSVNMLKWEFAHYSFLNLMVIYGLHLFVSLENKTALERRLLPVYLFLTFFFIIITGSRIGLGLYIMGGLVYGIIFLAKNMRPLYFRTFAFSSLVIIAVIIIMAPIPYQAIDSKRHHYAVRAIEALKQKPLLGHGTGDTKYIMHDPEFEKITGFPVNHPHNQYLDELLMYGVIGSLPLFLFLLAGFLRGLMLNDRALLMVILTVMIFMLVECPINSNKGSMPFLLAICILVFGRKKRNQAEQVPE